MYHIKVTEEFGRGLYADYAIEKGEMICQCEILALSEFDTLAVNMTDLKYYTFVLDRELGLDCLVLDDGEIFNHAPMPAEKLTLGDTANVRYELVNFDGRKVMRFSALRNIGADEQLFIDYGFDMSVNISEYIETKSLIGG
jgi:hypothetical protein